MPTTLDRSFAAQEAIIRHLEHSKIAPLLPRSLLLELPSDEYDIREFVGDGLINFCIRWILWETLGHMGRPFLNVSAERCLVSIYDIVHSRSFIASLSRMRLLLTL
jgi:hypothetical protein